MSANAAYLAAVDAACGAGGAQDLQTALGELQKAAELGHRRAQAELSVLVGNARLAADIAAGKPVRAETWRHLREAFDVSSWLRARPDRTLSTEPRIAMATGFVSHAACDWLVEQARPRLEPAVIYDHDTGAPSADPGRTNRCAALGKDSADAVVGFVRARVAALAAVSPLALETSAVLHYRVGEQFDLHHDFLDVRYAGYARQVAEMGQRGLTLLIYLNQGYQAGETQFPALGRGFKGRKGDALVFWNLTPDGSPDWRTEHAGTPLTRGEKWVFSQWIRVRV